PIAAGTWSFALQVADSAPNPRFRIQNYQIVVGPLTIMTQFLPTAPLGQPYNFTMTAGGSSTSPLTWSLVSGTLPAGILFNAAGVLSGTPTQPDCTSVPLTFRVTDSSAPVPQVAVRALTMFFSGTVRITTTSLNAATLNSTPPGLRASCGSGTSTFTIDNGSLPMPLGTTLNSNGGFTGQPRANGVFPVTFRVTDNSGSSTKTVNINVGAVDQQPGGGPGAAINVSTGRIAQTFTVGASGVLSHVRFFGLTCNGGPVTITIEELLATSGAPDDSHVLATFAPNTFSTTATQFFALPTPVARGVDSTLAVVLASGGSCSTLANSATQEFYTGGAAYFDSGSGGGAGATVPGLQGQTLIQNAGLKYLNGSNRGTTQSIMVSGGRVLSLTNIGVAELYDPETGVVTTIPMVAVRSDFSVTKLADGRVLVVGGFSGGVSSPTAEIFDPATNSFAATGSMSIGRNAHAAVRLTSGPNAGKVLVIGGQTVGQGQLSTTELFDPGTGTFSAGPNLVNGRTAPTATALNDGRVLVAGGFQFTATQALSAEIYDPTTLPNGMFSTTGAMVTPRGSHTATLLNDGNVLIAGGRNTITLRRTLGATLEIYSATLGTFSGAGTLITPRAQHTATLLGDGSVLLANGLRNASSTGPAWASAERFVPGTGSVGAPQPIVQRYNHGAALLPNGRVLLTAGFAGGSGSSGAQPGMSFELYDPGIGPNGTPSIANPTMPDGQTGVGYQAILVGTGGTVADQTQY